MYVMLARRHYLVDACRIGYVGIFQIFPESSRPQVQHRSPIRRDEVESLIIFAQHGKSLQHIIPVKR